MRKLMFFAALSGLALSPLTASAQTDIEPPASDKLTWVMTTPNIVSVDKAMTVRGDYVTVIDQIQLRGLPNKSLTISCTTNSRGGAANSRMQIVFDFDSKKDEFRSRIKMRQIAGHLNLGTEKHQIRFMYNHKTASVVPIKRVIAIKVFNAAIRGEALKLKALGKTQFDIVLPKPNQDFVEFVKACPALSGNKD